MKFCVCLLSILFSGYCFSAEFDSSIGFGVQYGGILGWQGSVSEEKVHGRLSIGLIGAAVGADLDINNYASIGVTAGGVGIATFKAINLNYYVDGKYTEGWRIGLDAGTAETNVFGKDSGSFVSVSFGYSFK